MITCTRRIQFCAGHRVPRHEAKCANLHGHNYVALFTAEADELDHAGRVIDFSVLKAKLGGWIDKRWDHGLVLQESDNAGRAAVKAFDGEAGPQKLYLMHESPTAENMARHLLLDVGPRVLAGTGVRLVAVRLWETENCYADAEL